MTWDKPVADLVARYLFAVEQALPRQLRGDVTRELRTLIEDKLEDRARTLAKPVDTALAMYVLREIGEPGEVARRYDPAPQYLVGPRFYPAFVRIAKIALPGLAGVLLLATVVGTLHSPQGTAGLLSLKTLLRFLTLYFQVGITLFGEAVIVLAILERTSFGRSPARPRDWDARDLPEVPKSEADRANPVALAVGICWLVLVGLLLNVFPGWLGVVMVTDGRATLVPLADFGIHLPMALLNTSLALTLVLNLVVLRQRRFTPITRAAQVGFGLFAAYVLFEIAALSILKAPPGAPGFAPLLRMAHGLLYIAPCLALIDPLRHLLRLIRGHRAVPAIGA
jgi:hypothetical protein